MGDTLANVDNTSSLAKMAALLLLPTRLLQGSSDWLYAVMELRMTVSIL
jgi:hypothetical protein